MGNADDHMRSAFGGVPVGVEFDPPALVEAPRLADATVAVVTMAALAEPGQPWTDQSHGFRVFDRHAEGLIMAHNSMNFDRVGFAADRNVAYPIDRLTEMEREGAIGKLAPRHLSFLGSTYELSTFVLDTGPAAAQLLSDDAVDVVLLTPV